MKRYLLCLPLLLSGCGLVMPRYEPTLATPAKSQVKYQADLQACRDYEKQVMDNPARNAVAGGFGLVGFGLMAATSDPNDDYFKSGKTVVDECMTKRGYKIVQN